MFIIRIFNCYTLPEYKSNTFLKPYTIISCRKINNNINNSNNNNVKIFKYTLYLESYKIEGKSSDLPSILSTHTLAPHTPSYATHSIYWIVIQILSPRSRAATMALMSRCSQIRESTTMPSNLFSPTRMQPCVSSG